MKYPKINTYWKRDEKGNILREVSKKEFEMINNWIVTEKIDGQNWRIYVNYKPSEVRGNKIEYEGLIMQGRTENTQFNEGVIERLKESLNPDKIKDAINGDAKAILYGELVGDKTQKNGWKYVREEQDEPKNDVILFDAYINGWWLKFEDVEKMAEDMDIKSVPILNCGEITVEDIEIFLEQEPKSFFGDRIIEGVVVKSNPPILFRDGKPIMWKLKMRDIDNGAG